LLFKTVIDLLDKTAWLDLKEPSMTWSSKISTKD
jgi:hypothetical protein